VGIQGVRSEGARAGDLLHGAAHGGQYFQSLPHGHPLSLPRVILVVDLSGGGHVLGLVGVGGHGGRAGGLQIVVGVVGGVDGEVLYS